MGGEQPAHGRPTVRRQAGVLWLPNTSTAGYTYFNRYYFAQQNKEGVVLDERWPVGVRGRLRRRSGQASALRVLQQPGRTTTTLHHAQAGIWDEGHGDQRMAGSGGDLMPYMFRKQRPDHSSARKPGRPGRDMGYADTRDGGAITNPRGGFIN